MTFEKVLFVFDKWDGPIMRLALCFGFPIYFERQFNELRDEWSDQYEIYPVDKDSLRLAENLHKLSEEWIASKTTLSFSTWLANHKESIEPRLDDFVRFVKDHSEPKPLRGSFRAASLDEDGIASSYEVTWRADAGA
jgi:hypothetical protein